MAGQGVNIGYIQSKGHTQQGGGVMHSIMAWNLFDFITLQYHRRARNESPHEQSTPVPTVDIRTVDDKHQFSCCLLWPEIHRKYETKGVIRVITYRQSDPEYSWNRISKSHVLKITCINVKMVSEGQSILVFCDVGLWLVHSPAK